MHSTGVMQRDVKPSSVLVEEYTGGFDVKIIDFGLALINDGVENA